MTSVSSRLGTGSIHVLRSSTEHDRTESNNFKSKTVDRDIFIGTSVYASVDWPYIMDIFFSFEMRNKMLTLKDSNFLKIQFVDWAMGLEIRSWVLGCVLAPYFERWTWAGAPEFAMPTHL